MFVTYVNIFQNKNNKHSFPGQTGSGVWSRIELMVGKNGQYWQQSSFTNVTKFFLFILSNTNISDIHKCYHVLPNLQKIWYVFAWLQRISLGGGVREFIWCLKVFFYLLMWVKVFAPHQVWIVKTPSGHKTPSSPSNQPLGKWANF